MATQETPNQKISERIKKLLALAKGGTTEGEASAAMAKVQELLADYNLTMAQVESSTQTTDTTAQVADAPRTKDKYEKSALYKYQRRLMRVIADCHFCLYWTGETYDYKNGRRLTRYHHVLVGREANVATARVLFDYLNSTIEKLATAEYPVPLNLSKAALSWKEGCADRLCDRLYDRKIDADQAQAETVKKAQQTPEAATTSALMLLTDVRHNEDDLNRDFLCGYKPGETAANRAKWELEAAKVKTEPKEEPKPLTDKEKAKQEEANRKYWERWEKKQQKARAAKDWDAYFAGNNKGQEIGLDTQVGGTV